MAKTASYPVISLGLDASGITEGLAAARNILKSGMSSLSSAVSTPLFGVALANQASEFGQKINRLFLEPFRQLMQQEDLFSRFSVLAGGTDKAGKALDQFKGISRATGLSLTELSTSLDTLLQGQFSFSGAVAQIEDLSKVASILGEGSLPMLTQAAAKFRSNAFVGFEDINSVAASGLPIFEALAQQIGVTADEARGLARNGMITGLQARGALNGAAVMGAEANGGQQEQTLSGVVSRLREGLNQTLAEIGGAFSKLIDVPSLLSRFRGIMEAVRSVVSQMFGPLVDVVGKGNLQQVFDEAKNFTFSLLQVIGNELIGMSATMISVVNYLIDILNAIRTYFASQDPNAGVRGLFNQAGGIMFGAGDWLGKKLGVNMEGQNPFDAKAMAEARRKFQEGAVPIAKFAAVPVAEQMGKLDKFLTQARDAAANNKAMVEAAMEADRLAENFNQAKDALGQFGQAFKNAMGDPFKAAQDNLMRFNQLLAEADAQGVGIKDQLLADNMDVAAAIGKQFLDIADGMTSKLNEVKLATADSVSSTAGYSAVAKFLSSPKGPGDPQERIRRAIEAQTEINKKQRDAAINTFNAIKGLNLGANIAVVNF